MSFLDFVSILKTGSDFCFDVFRLCFSVYGFDIVLFIVTSYGVIFAAKCISNSHSSDLVSTLKSYNDEKQRRIESQNRKAAFEKGRQSASNKKSGD